MNTRVCGCFLRNQVKFTVNKIYFEIPVICSRYSDVTLRMKPFRSNLVTPAMRDAK